MNLDDILIHAFGSQLNEDEKNSTKIENGQEVKTPPLPTHMIQGFEIVHDNKIIIRACITPAITHLLEENMDQAVLEIISFDTLNTLVNELMEQALDMCVQKQLITNFRDTKVKVVPLQNIQVGQPIEISITNTGTSFDSLVAVAKQDGREPFARVYFDGTLELQSKPEKDPEPNNLPVDTADVIDLKIPPPSKGI